jgi:hypothetical protein
MLCSNTGWHSHMSKSSTFRSLSHPHAAVGKSRHARRCHEAWLVKAQLPRGTFPSKAFAQRRLFSLTLGRLGTGCLQHFGCKRKYLCTCTNWLPWESGMCCTCLCHFVSFTLAGDLQLQAWATMPQIKMQACYILLLLSTPAHINIIPAHRRHVAQSQP